MDNELPSHLKLKAPLKVDKQKCEKAQKFLKWDDLPTVVEETDYDVAKVWWVYENEHGGDHFKMFLCIPIYEVWGAKKRKKYLDARK